MPDYRLRIEAEYEAIENSLSALPSLPLSTLSILELRALINNFYNGIEAILRQVFQSRALPIPQGKSWHRDLLLSAVEKEILSASLLDNLKPYLAFRHFFGHRYAMNLLPELMEPLVREAQSVFRGMRPKRIEKTTPPDGLRPTLTSNVRPF